MGVPVTGDHCPATTDCSRLTAGLSESVSASGVLASGLPTSWPLGDQ